MSSPYPRQRSVPSKPGILSAAPDHADTAADRPITPANHAPDRDHASSRISTEPNSSRPGDGRRRPLTDEGCCRRGDDPVHQIPRRVTPAGAASREVLTVKTRRRGGASLARRCCRAHSAAVTAAGSGCSAGDGGWQRLHGR